MKPSKNLIIILAAGVILLSAWVYYMSQVNQASVSESEREFRQVTQQSSSDETGEIEEDLEATDFEDLDSELTDIEAELNSTTEAKQE